MSMLGKLQLTIKIDQVPAGVKTIENGWKQFEIDTGGQLVTLTFRPQVFKQLEQAQENYSLWVAVIVGQISNSDKGFLLKDCSATVYPLETFLSSSLPNTELQPGVQKIAENAGEKEAGESAFTRRRESGRVEEAENGSFPPPPSADSPPASRQFAQRDVPPSSPSPTAGNPPKVLSHSTGVAPQGGFPADGTDQPHATASPALGSLQQNATSYEVLLRSKSPNTRGLVFMRKLIKGTGEFKANYFSNHQHLFEELSQGQKPQVLFITCSDSRIDPNLITQTQMGELFVIRNAGNIIPPFGAANGGEGAAVEYAIHNLGIEQVIVCGHSHCGAMKGLLQVGNLQQEMPLVYDWLKHAEATARIVKENYSNYEGEELLKIAIGENVLTQIENLKTYPVVRSKLNQGKLQIYGWVYRIETGEVLAYDPVKHAYRAPQYQLTGYHTQEEPKLGQLTSTSAPPVADELPQRQPQRNATANDKGNGVSQDPLKVFLENWLKK